MGVRRERPLQEVAVTAWYCCHLADDEVAELVGLPSAEVRADWLRCFLDGYGLDAADRSRIVPSILEFAVMDNAWFARGKNITPEQNDLTAEDVWLLSWQTRAAAWVLEHRALLEEASGRASATAPWLPWLYAGGFNASSQRLVERMKIPFRQGGRGAAEDRSR